MKFKTCSLLIILFYSVGLFGFMYTPTISLFKQLVPFHLLLMTGLLISTQPLRSHSFWTFLAITYVAGFLIELAGTQTGLIFGSYAYGSTLGFKVFGTPLMIGVNWILVIYSVGMTLWQFGVRNRYAFVSLGAASVTVLDFLIEPVAMKYDYWDWAGGIVPVQNYIVWFFFSAFLLFLFQRSAFRKDNRSASTLFIVQFLFFLILYLQV